jgi:hypothetical protein
VKALERPQLWQQDKKDLDKISQHDSAEAAEEDTTENECRRRQVRGVCLACPFLHEAWSGCFYA